MELGFAEMSCKESISFLFFFFFRVLGRRRRKSFDSLIGTKESEKSEIIRRLEMVFGPFGLNLINYMGLLVQRN